MLPVTLFENACFIFLYLVHLYLWMCYYTAKTQFKMFLEALPLGCLGCVLILPGGKNPETFYEL